jgi:hypothetical protein
MRITDLGSPSERAFNVAAQEEVPSLIPEAYSWHGQTKSVFGKFAAL